MENIDLKGKKLETGQVDVIPVPRTKKRKQKSRVKKKKQPVKRHDEADSSDGDEFVVEAILKKRIKSGRTEYLIKWFGWPSEANTWEPAKHLAGCKWMIEKFEANYLEKTEGSVSIKSETIAKVEGSAGIEPPISEGRPVGSNANQGYIPLTRVARNAELEKREKNEACREKDLYHGILDQCPQGKTVKAIHAVTTVHGFLVHLVEWISEDNSNSKDTELNPAHVNMVLAMSMNQNFPQDVINFYENHLTLINNCMPESNERKGALNALSDAKARRDEDRRSVIKLMELEDDEDDATIAIEQEQRMQDKFDTYLSESDFEEEFYDEMNVEVEVLN